MGKLYEYFNVAIVLRVTYNFHSSCLSLKKKKKKKKKVDKVGPPLTKLSGSGHVPFHGL